MYTLYFVVISLCFASSLQKNWHPEDCPAQCSCAMEWMYKKVYCDLVSRRRLTVMPRKFPADAESISLQGNRIATIPAEAFANLTNLRHLNLGSNDLQTLQSNVFNNLTALESLNLSNNRLKTLPSGLLRGLNSLKHLYLDGNVLENLPKDFFKGLVALQRLLLDRNKFYTFLSGEQQTPTNLSPLTISNHSSLVELLLHYNGIEQVAHDSFNKMSQLKRLTLNNNNISKLPRGIFRDMKSLRMLSLYKNPFQCTCSLKWLKHWIKHNRKSVTVFYPQLIQCKEPARLRGRELLNVKDDEFGCDKEWNLWSKWSNCSKKCDGGIQTRTRQCKTRTCEGRNLDARWCNRHRCSLYTQWSSWSTCNAECGVGLKIRKRQCLSAHKGISCVGHLNETQVCKIKECSQWSEWGSWSTCSKTCSQGVKIRKRTCESEILNGSIQSYCPGNNTSWAICKTKPCPVDGQWSPWQQWSSCSKSCGFGYKTRHRSCSNPHPKFGGSLCEGQPLEIKWCMPRLCNNTSEFTPWSEWSQCSAQCGIGFKYRNRSCRQKDSDKGPEICLGSKKEYKECMGTNCTTTWGVWSTWSKCLGNCLNGQAFRMRYCVDTGGKTGVACEKNKTFDIETKSCKPSSCDVEAVWTSWTKWSACSRSCARGTKRRQRYCITANILGKPCRGNHESKMPCNLQPCPINGGWSAWSEWGKCNKTCGGGIKERFRSCSEPKPAFGGQICEGAIREITICNTHQCKSLILNDGKPKQSFTLLIPKKCPTLPSPKNGRIRIKEQKDSESFVEYKCDKYFRNQELSLIRYCKEDGSWTGFPAKCVPECGIRKESAENKQQRQNLTEKSIRTMREFWPWQVAIKVPISTSVYCGGTLIKDQWVLTAAHCVYIDNPKKFEEITVILGTNNYSDDKSKYRQVVPVKLTCTHEDFKWGELSSDIAILKLQRKVNITKYVRPACLPRENSRQKLVAGKEGYMVGWGGQDPNLLRQLRLPVVHHRECKESYKVNGYIITRKMLCAGYKDRENKNYGLRKKDSGSGFFFLKRKKGRKSRWILRGIASWRHPNPTQKHLPEKYSVFTDVKKHIWWIQDKIEDLS
ncbi:LOW QUALITY PROTEIN: uncharacterized protein LOC124443619 [Xenia sp. Carnegie-2017]|uniref:LOW QUALITY PROTEIN: uncharacterized protein LOC124443619 n=1 Tax=Xenia sp. Carnegie-2017 TaxID=2897299 RepID=UPI001F04CB1B|nr:LOW QUALITY PROTEIN: uncharacterized protein LOC124443619 [Xenia sp. Carnegie-2017]